MEEQEIIAELCQIKGWPELNGTQKIAVDKGLLTTKNNLVVIAPTSSGKTGIAELAYIQVLKEKGRVAYLVPSASLISSKKSEFDYLSSRYNIYPDDKKTTFGNADLVISTFEAFYRTTLQRPDLLSNFLLIVIDEFHVLYDKWRGFNLEKVLTLLKESSARIICLSATFENKDNVTNWLDATLVLVPESERKVQLEHDYLNLIKSSNDNLDLFRFLESGDKYPSIVFCSRKDWAESRAGNFAGFIADNYNSPEEIKSDFEEKIGRILFTSQETKLLSCVIRGVGFHHAKMSSELKPLIEEYIREGKIRYLFCTTTLAYGMNFPAKSVVLHDLDWWDFERGGYAPIPVHTYIQMAGRAGRGDAFSNEGYSYLLAKKPDHITTRIPEYLALNLEEAKSNISIDDYFRKTILELIYSRRNTTNEIMAFFENTYFHYLSSLYQDPLAKYDLLETIRPHTDYLMKYGFIISQGASGFKLTDLSEVVIEFLFTSYIAYDLDLFLVMNNVLDKNMEVEYDFNLLYQMFQLFSNLQTNRLGRKRSSEIDDYFISHYKNIRNKRNVGNAEYSSYAIFHGWINNLDEVTIEERYLINASIIESNVKELYKLLDVYKKLAEKKHIDIPNEFNALQRRIYHGVTEEELSFKMMSGIGRETCRTLKTYCNSVLKGTDFNYTGSLEEILYNLLTDIGETEFLSIMIGNVTHIGRRRAESILEVIKNYEKSLNVS